MRYTNNIRVLVADSDDKNRKYVAGILELNGFQVQQAIDGGTAIKVVEEQGTDLAVVRYRMKPHGGLEFAKHLLVKGHDIGVIMLTSEATTDLLMEAGNYNIRQIMENPVEPQRFIETVRRVLRIYGKNPDAIGMGDEKQWTPDELMHRAIMLARQNADSGMGGPFGAVVADAAGRILGEGVNGVKTRCDPTAHAEVLAIRRATEKRASTDLTGCVVYSSSEPTMLGEALIIGTGIEKVFYGLSHEETGAARVSEAGIMGEIAKPLSQRTVSHEQRGHDEALAMFLRAEAAKKTS
ncbi:MAG: response regulator [Rhodospirillales bacterium]|nr:response regulator [Rhodospirillales bacterium]